jgi:hypothetical protein
MQLLWLTLRRAKEMANLIRTSKGAPAAVAKAKTAKLGASFRLRLLT